MFSKNERRTDTKTYGDKKALFDGVSYFEPIFIGISMLIAPLFDLNSYIIFATIFGMF